jgi:hypothetical protein
MSPAATRTLPRGATLHHTTLRNADGTPLRARVTGRPQTWVRRPEHFRLPMKHGLRDSFYIDELSCAEWAFGPGDTL